MTVIQVAVLMKIVVQNRNLLKELKVIQKQCNMIRYKQNQVRKVLPEEYHNKLKNSNFHLVKQFKLLFPKLNFNLLLYQILIKLKLMMPILRYAISY